MIKRAVKGTWNDDRGSMLIIMGAALPLLVGAAGLATDTIQWTLWKRQLQRAADSAAIAGVYTRITVDQQTDVEGAVGTDIALNNHVGIALAANFPVVELPADDGVKKKQVKVTLQISKALPFSSMFMASRPTIRAVSTAASVPGAAEYCVIALDPSVTATGIEITGSTDIDMGECSLIANSKNPTAAATNGNSGGSGGGQNSFIKAKSLAAGGGVKYSNNWNIQDYDPNSPPVADPFAAVNVPAKSTCSKFLANKFDKNQDYPQDRTLLDTAGDIVCITGAMTVAGALKLASGVTYVLDGGGLTMTSGSASLACTHCTVVMTNYVDPTKTGNVKLTGGTLAMTAPVEDGPFKGIALFQDRLAADGGGKGQNHINGNSGAAVTGVMYFPNRSLLYNGGGKITAVCMQIVAKRVEFSGSSNIKLSSLCGSDGIKGIGGGYRVRLVA